MNDGNSVSLLNVRHFNNQTKVGFRWVFFKRTVCKVPFLKGRVLETAFNVPEVRQYHPEWVARRTRQAE